MAQQRLICSGCGKRAWAEEPVPGSCEECGAALRRMGRLELLMDRLVAPPDQGALELHHRHTQLIELLWTADNRAQQLYSIVQPRGVSYSGFVSRITEVVCRGINEGWVSVRLPAAPSREQRDYELTILDPERFAAEVDQLFPKR